MPRLADLLEYLTQPGLEDVWVLLDIKVGHVLVGLHQIMLTRDSLTTTPTT